jgi:hypothetical protein
VSFAVPSGATACVAAAQPTLGRRAANVLLCRRAASSQLLKGEAVLVSRSVLLPSMRTSAYAPPRLGDKSILQWCRHGHVQLAHIADGLSWTQWHATGRRSQRTSGGSTSSSAGGAASCGCCRRSSPRSLCAASAWASSSALQRRPPAEPAQGAPLSHMPLLNLPAAALAAALPLGKNGW